MRYTAHVRGDVTEAKLALLRRGLVLEGTPLPPCTAERVDDTTLRLGLTGGPRREEEIWEARAACCFSFRVSPFRNSYCGQVETHFSVLISENALCTATSYLLGQPKLVSRVCELVGLAAERAHRCCYPTHTHIHKRLLNTCLMRPEDCVSSYRLYHWRM